MTRIIAGAAKGLTLIVPSSARPTSDRVREALFSALDHRGYIEDSLVLDLFAGSGAFGLEAVSRGARGAVGVDMSRSAHQAMVKNAGKSGLNLTAHCAKAETFLAGDTASYDIIFIDPPYDYPEEKLEGVLALAAERLVDDGLLIVERSKRSPEPAWPAGIEAEKPKKWGDTTMWTASRAT